MRGRGGALLGRALVRQAGDAVHLAVERHRPPGAPAGRRLAGEEVVRVGEVLEAGEVADARGDAPGEAVVRDVQLLGALHAGNGLRQRALEAVEADVEDGYAAEQPDLERDAAGEVVIEEDDLVKRVGHAADGRGDAPAEVVIGEDKDGDGGRAQGGGDTGTEAVGVEEDGVEGPLKEPRRDGPLEVVEAEVEVTEGRQVEHHLGELADEAVVAEVQLK